MSCVTDIQKLLDLFHDKVVDSETNRLVHEHASDKAKWHQAKNLFNIIRDRNLKAMKDGDKNKECQYCFEEVCAKTLYNLTRPNAPFDPDSPYWIIKTALNLAKQIGMPIEDVLDIVSR